MREFATIIALVLLVSNSVAISAHAQTRDTLYGRSADGAYELPQERGATERPAPGPRAARDVVPAPDGSAEYVVVVPRADVRLVSEILASQRAVFLRQTALPSLEHQMLFFAFPVTLSLDRARQLVARVTPNATLDLHNIYALSQAPKLFAAKMIGADPVCRLSRPVRVGLIDGPVRADHPALQGVRIKRLDTRPSGSAMLAGDHGTAIAQIIAGHHDAGALAGFASGAGLYAVTAFARGSSGSSGRLESIATGLDWLSSQHVAIVNLSFSGPANTALEKILELTSGRGPVLVAAAGNDKSLQPRYPAASLHTIAVTAVDARNKLYKRANHGPHIEFAAPGVDLWSATAKGAGYQTGTSFAAPIVTALLAHERAKGPLSLKSARQSLALGARDLGATGRDASFGHGLVSSPC